MKTKKTTLLSTAALAMGAALLLAPHAMADDRKTTLNSADEKFVRHEAAAGVALVKFVELGAKKAEREDVKTFAGMLATDHAKANGELAALAQAKGVALAAEVDPKHADAYKELGEEGEGNNFDKKFLSLIVSGHKDCVDRFEAAANDAEDSDVKSWVAKMLPALQAHLGKAKELTAAPATAPVRKEVQSSSN